MFGVSVDMSCVSIYLFLAIVSILLYWTFLRLTDTENWTKYGVKQVVMPLVQLIDGFEKLIEEHGDTVGIKRSKMWLVTRDLTILKEVMVKDFNNFTDRPFDAVTRSVIGKGVFFLKGKDWRRIRHIITPSFSSSKLKNIFNTLEDRSKKLATVLEDVAMKDQFILIKHICGQYACEIIARTAFGLNSDCLGGEDNEFTYYSNKLVRFQNRKFTALLPVFQRFPWIAKLLVKVLGIKMFDSVSVDADQYLTNVMKASMSERYDAERQGKQLPADLLQNFIGALNAAQSDEVTSSLSDTDQPVEYNVVNKTLSKDELIGQSLLILFAGLETTSTALHLCYYLLAKHPDIQNKLCEEIDRVVQADCPTYEELSQLTYTEQVINETLRIYPPITLATRVAAETKTYGNITIPKGAAVFIPIFSILKDPKHFPDPDKFDPDRFNQENTAQRDPMAFIPFGYGPRQCIGMKMAYLELKMALAMSLRKVQFELNDQTEPKKGEEPKILMAAEFLVVAIPIKLCVKLRT
ncbi:hypothetical protein Btru_045764 [Bulinus truncatus]|nr:hypothetical protein Btru_045764 [Bulinus truncatus]